MSRISAYGLACSTNFEWGLQTAAPAPDAPAVTLVLGELCEHSVRRTTLALRPHADPERPPIARLERGADGHYRMCYGDGAEFVFSPELDVLHGISRSALTKDDLLVYLQGPILGLLLRLRGVTCLHASAAICDGRALVVMGEGGIGKSTSAAAFALLGLPVLSDDVTALDLRADDIYVQPGLPRVLLWPPSVSALFGHEDALPRAVSTWDKRYLDLNEPGYRFASSPAPLGAIYVLGERLPAGEQPRIASLTGVDALVHLLANTYAHDLIDTAAHAHELPGLGRLASQVPVRSMRAPDDLGSLLATCQALVDDFRGLTGGR